MNELKKLLAGSGVDKNSVQYTSYKPAGDDALAPITLSYVTYAASAAECGGDWSENLGFTPRNQPWPDFGCSSQHNFAAIVADPRDLIEPHASDPADAGRRSTVNQNYQAGRPTGAVRDPQMLQNSTRAVRRVGGGKHPVHAELEALLLLALRARVDAEQDVLRAVDALGIERTTMSSASAGGGVDLDGHLAMLARHVGLDRDPHVRQDLAQIHVLGRLRSLNARRAAANAKARGGPGPEGSVGKLLSTQRAQRISDVVSRLLGSRLAADTGEWGTFAWSEYVAGVPGQRLAGGTDEIQRNAIGERGLGLPREPRP